MPQINILKDVAKKLQVSQSEVVRRSIDLFVSSYEKHQKINMG
jgi:hypothetical protein